MSDVEIHHLGAAYALDALDERERAAFEAHYESCDVCRADVQDFRATVAALAAASSSAPPADLKSKVLADIAETRQLSPLLAGVVDLREHRSRTWVVRAAAVAAAILAFVAGVAVERRDAPDPYAAALSDVLDHPDGRLVTLGRTDAPGGGKGTVEVAWSDQLDSAVLLADGLPQAPAGHAYELWMIGAAGSVPMSVLDRARDGRLRTVLRIDGDPTGWGVTIEPESGSPVPTGDILYLAQV